jgi:hypothetical protein
VIYKLNKVWFLFFLSKLIYTFLAVFIYSRLTSLGDSSAYLASAHSKVNWAINSSALMDYSASKLSVFLGAFGTHIFFSMLAFYGIYNALEKANLSKRYLYFVLGLLSFPSIGIWTSIISKESVMVFACGIFIRFIFQVHKGEKVNKKLILGISFYLITIFKPQYLAVFLPLLFYIKFKTTLFRAASAKIFVLLSYMITIIVASFLNLHSIQDLAIEVATHFNQDAASTRKEAFWKEPYDFFTRMPYGFYISFVGPTLSEALVKLTHLLSLVESWIILLIGIRFYLYSILERSNHHRFDINIFSISVLIYFGFLFFHYPFGVMNPGSAIRYRAGFLPAALILLAYFNFHRSRYVRRSL